MSAGRARSTRSRSVACARNVGTTVFPGTHRRSAHECATHEIKGERDDRRTSRRCQKIYHDRRARARSREGLQQRANTCVWPGGGQLKPRGSSTSSPNTSRCRSTRTRFARKLYTTLPSRMDAVSAAGGAESELAEYSDTHHSTNASGCSAALFVLMMAA